jgi:squalene-hopene/tetraprenyl-beta-curcumene cyclase
MKKSLTPTMAIATALLLTFSLLSCWSDEPPSPKQAGTVTLVSSEQPPGKLDVSLQNEANAAIDRGLDWLAAQQKEDGTWSNPDFPALTALACWPFINGLHPNKAEILDRAKKYILTCVKEDGGIYNDIKERKGGGLSNYNTAICMTALHAMNNGDKTITQVVLNARKFIAGSQHFGDDVYQGGFGYDRDTNRKYTDAMNTFYSMEAMAKTADAEDHRPKTEKKVDINWAESVKFFDKVQNKPAAGKDDEGGVFYRPDESKAGTITNEAGVVTFRSYGSITYAGLLALVYARIDRDDVRVASAFDWASRHWSLEENPGMGKQGLFFFYKILAKCMDAYQIDLLPLKDGSFVDWKTELATTLVSMQKIDEKTGKGYWVNDTGRFWENDPVLSTAYCLTALQTAAAGDN